MMGGVRGLLSLLLHSTTPPTPFSFPKSYVDRHSCSLSFFFSLWDTPIYSLAFLWVWGREHIQCPVLASSCEGVKGAEWASWGQRGDQRDVYGVRRADTREAKKSRLSRHLTEPHATESPPLTQL